VNTGAKKALADSDKFAVLSLYIRMVKKSSNNGLVNKYFELVRDYFIIKVNILISRVPCNLRKMCLTTSTFSLLLIS
jgi:hypothetical protein